MCELEDIKFLRSDEYLKARLIEARDTLHKNDKLRGSYNAVIKDLTSKQLGNNND